jgi:SNF2 family DNA or RNA helicase
MWLLSGSPTTRHADDLWTQLHLLWPAAFPSYWRFAERYCYIEETPWAKVVTGTRSNRDAAEDNSDLMYVVNQEDVLDLPEYLFETIDVDLGTAQRREYERMRKEFVAELNGEEVIAANEIARLQKLQQITSWWDGNSAKRDALVDLIDSYEGPHLIWTHWRDAGTDIFVHLAAKGLRVNMVNGSVPTKDRDFMLEQFKAGELDALVLSIGVGKFGHTLTQAKTVWYLDKTWAADDYFQSLRRVRRIGLTHRPVVVTLRAPGTVDELVEDNLEGKMGGISRITKSRLAELLKGLGR